MKTLVVGATGQLGFAITKNLLKKKGKSEVFASHRAESNIAPLSELKNLKLRSLDLTEPDTYQEAVKGIEAVVATANSATPVRKDDKIKTVDIKGMKGLIDACKKAGVKHFIYVSALPFPKGDDNIPLSKAKREVENHLKASGLKFTIIQPSAFMEVYFPFFGTKIPLRGEKVATLKRPFKFSNDFFKGIENDIEEKGKFNIIGNGHQKCGYISLQSVAQLCANVVGNVDAMDKTLKISGPETLSVLEVKQIFEEVYDKPLKVKATPKFVIKLMSKILKPFNPAAANIMALNYAAASNDYFTTESSQVAKMYEVDLISAREFLNQKMAQA